jgi:ribosomal protein L4
MGVPGRVLFPDILRRDTLVLTRNAVEQLEARLK